MSPSKPNNQPLRKSTATLSILTFILSLTTLSTTAATYRPGANHPSSTYPLAASTLATLYTLSLLILTLLATRRSPTFHLAITALSTSFLALFLGIIYLSNSSALLPCTAGTTSASHNPYVRRCQLRQTVFWSAVLGAVGFAVLAVVTAMAFVRARRAMASSMPRSSAMGKNGEADAVSVAPPSYQEKDKDVEGEGEWEERVRAAV